MTAAARAVAVTIAALFLGGCLHAGSGNPAAVVVLFDNTRSADAPGIAKQQRAAFDRVRTWCSDGRGAFLAGYLIDDNPLTSPHRFTATFRSQGGNETKIQYVSKIRRIDAYVKQSSDRLLSVPTADAGTAIMDAVVQADRFFANHEEAGKRVLVILSDMIEESDRLNASRIDSPEERETMIAEERSAGRLPDLSGVTVYVAGAGPNALSEQPANRVRAWQEYWMAYFAAAGAELEASHYAAQLTGFPPQ